MPFAGILEILEPFLRGAARHPEETLLHFGSRIFNVATSYHRISGDHLADHLIYLSSPSPLHCPSPSLPLHPSCAIHCRPHPCVATLPSIAVTTVSSITIVVTIAITLSIAVHRRHCHHIAVAPCITDAVTSSIAIAPPSHCRCANHLQRRHHRRCTVHHCPSLVLLRRCCVLILDF